MGIVREAQPAKLFMGIMHPPELNAGELTEKLSHSYGPIDLKSDTFVFNYSDYYQDEMGPGLVKFFVSFGPLIPQNHLARVKTETNDLEQKGAREKGGRSCNLDPGLLTLSSVILATTKDYAHRIYMENGIYGEVTLIFAKGRYDPLPWTYPDYRSEVVLDFMKKARNIYHQQLKALSGGKYIA